MEINTIEDYEKMEYDRKRYFLFEMMKYQITDKKIIEKVLSDTIGCYPNDFVDKIIEGNFEEILEFLRKYEFFYMDYDFAIPYYFTAKRYDMIEFFINKFNGISTTIWAESLISCAQDENLEEFEYLIKLIPKIYVSNIRSKESGMEKSLRLFNITGFHTYFKDEDTDEFIINRVINIAYEHSLYKRNETIRCYIINNKLLIAKEDSEIKSRYAKYMNNVIKELLSE